MSARTDKRSLTWEVRVRWGRARVLVDRVWSDVHHRELALIVLLVIIALVAHAVNMFGYPSFTLTDDEGIYASRAWAVLRLGSLSPYTYVYDHAPAGWILTAGWMALTGGVRTFGGAIDSGRVLMLILHLASVPLLYRIARKLGCRMGYAALATLLFSLSPLAIFNQRLLLLDNIMIFWLLLSLNLLLDGWGRLSRVALSGICFGVAVLTKETAIFLFPALLYTALHQRWRHQGRFALAGWLLPILLVTSLYPLYALLKGELLPAGSAAGFAVTGRGSGVSLTEALQWQATRGGGGVLNLHNSFWVLVRTEWLPMDPVLIVAGVLATVVDLVRGLRGNRLALAAGLLALCPLVYLARGGVVFGHYIIFAIPFLCLNVAVVATSLEVVWLRSAARRWASVIRRWAPAGAAAALVAVSLQLGTLQPLYTQRPSEAGRRALAWIKDHVPSNSSIIAGDDLWTDLHEPGDEGPAFRNVYSHWEVASDPDVRKGVFDDDWRKVDYLITKPGIEGVYESTHDTVALDAMENSTVIKRWEVDSGVVELRKVNRSGVTEDRLLDRAATFMERRFERRGAYIEDGSVFSESQAYAMLRAVWSGDRAGFFRSWRWTRAHLITRSGLPAWHWRRGKIVDRNSATDADTDMALALLFAGKRFHDPDLIRSGLSMVRSIWRHDVASISGVPYVTAGGWATSGPVATLNPSYFSPYAYRLFSDIDKRHDWMGVIDSGYRALFQATSARLGGPRSAGLPPDWVGLRRDTREIVPVTLAQRPTSDYGYDAARTFWRLALDLRWSGDGRARTYLRQAGFLREEAARKGRVSAVYSHAGRIVEDRSSTVGTAGAMAALLTLDPKEAHELYVKGILLGARPRRGSVSWGRTNDLYSQEWAWFATAFYAERLTNIWYVG